MRTFFNVRNPIMQSSGAVAFFPLTCSQFSFALVTNRACVLFFFCESQTIAPSIEQTRMPNWNLSAESSTRMASVNENSYKRPSQ